MKNVTLPAVEFKVFVLNLLVFLDIIKNMEMETFKTLVANNLVWYRKKSGLTQLQLAEKLSYSDKAVSKWERGESLPDAYTLNTLAEFYGVTLNDFLTKKRKDPVKNSKKMKLLISIMSSLLTLVVATVSFVISGLVDVHYLGKAWLAFVYSVPIIGIILLVFSSIWGRRWMQLVTTSTIIWGLAASVYLSLLILVNDDITIWWLVFILAIPVQVGFALWYYFRHLKKPLK